VAPRIHPAARRQSKEELAQELIEDRSYRAPYALAGMPALALCCGFSAGGLPISLQIAAKPLRDDLVLMVGHAYQQVTEWHTTHPPLD
jgi:aspartyl-tRNA(Asn)/glutamyl-tRNA(Gln) amidotransferase subunit A